MNILHIYGIFLRNIILIRRSVGRMFGLFFFSTFELFLWGFVTLWLRDLAGDDSRFNFVFLLLTGLIFWHLFIRAQQSFSISFLEDVWSRNIMNFFAAPVTTKEFITGLAFISITQGFLSFFYISVLATVLYSLEVWSLGFYMIPFFVNIFVFGWTLGLIAIGLLLRFGPAFEILAFFLPMMFLPFSAVYYPVSVFPEIIQHIAFFLPTMHMFEGMRAVLTQEAFPMGHALWATGLNVLYFLLGFSFFTWMVHVARKRGLLARLMTD
jgi:ABC-2 type transport system permease protein